jgi:hypothetical protein
VLICAYLIQNEVCESPEKSQFALLSVIFAELRINLCVFSDVATRLWRSDYRENLQTIKRERRRVK